jgi:outer membrane protein assembly factor BamE (lipoprotein component of BamABCDE complex)
MKRLSIFIVFTLIFLLLPCCSSYRYGAGEENVQKSNLTFGVVKSKIIKGQTTQEEILAIFGAPNMVTKNKSDNEVWSYNRMSSVSKGGKTSFIFGEKASVSNSSQSFDLIITFDEQDVVNDYSVISTSF